MTLSLHKLKSIVDQLESLEDHKTKIMEDIREVLAGAKSEGYDTKTLRQVLKIRRMKPEQVSEQEELLHLYLEALRKSGT